MSIARNPMTGAPEAIHHALNDYFVSYKESERPVSVRAAVEHLKGVIRDHTLSDAELCDIVADHAILRGMNLHFDGKQSSPTKRWVKKPDADA